MVQGRSVPQLCRMPPAMLLQPAQSPFESLHKDNSHIRDYRGCQAALTVMKSRVAAVWKSAVLHDYQLLLVSWDKEASRLVHFQRDCECARYCTEQGVVQVVCTCTMLGNSVQLPTERRECRTFLANLGICSSDTSWGRAGGGGAAA
jgi:hypothetical protein